MILAKVAHCSVPIDADLLPVPRCFKLKQAESQFLRVPKLPYNPLITVKLHNVEI